LEAGDRIVPKWGYSAVGLDPDTTVKASGREFRVSPKAAGEVCVAIKGMKLDDAKEFLQQVMSKKKAVAYRRYKKTVPHRHGLEKFPTGRYPVKAAEKVLEVLENAEANAMYKGLNAENLRIIHASAFRGVRIRRYIPRAFGRSSPRFETLCHVEIVLEQRGET